MSQEEHNNILIEEDFGYIEMETLDFDSSKEYKRFIKGVELLVRKSPEYKLWISFIKDTKGINYCYFTNEVNDEVTIEIHHHPFTLYDLVSIAINNKMRNNEKFTSYQIAKEIMTLHYQNKVGYIPLVKTLHEKFHNGFLQIPIELVEGDWKKIFDTYEEIPMDIQEKINIYASIHANPNQTAYNWSKDQYMIHQDSLSQIAV